MDYKYSNNHEYVDDADSAEVKMVKIEKSEEELELFKALKHKRAWDAELDMGDSCNYMTKEMLEKLGFIRIEYSDYGRRMVREAQVEIHGFTFLVDFYVIEYANKGDPSIVFGRDFLVMTKSKVDFGIGEIRIDLTMLEEEKDIGIFLDNWMKLWKKLGAQKLDDVLMGRERLSNKEFSEEDKVRIIELGLPKKISDLGNYVLPVQVNGVVEMSALADTSASVSVLPYSLYQNIGLGDPKPYHSNLTMVDNTQAKAIGEVRNVRIQIGYQAYLVDFFVLDILVDNELPLLLGSPFLSTYGAVIDIGRDIEDVMERALAMEAYFNLFKNIIVFKKLINFLRSLPVQLKDTNWGNEVHRLYKKVNGDGAWHEKFKIITPSGRKFTKGFKIKETKRKLSGKFTLEDILKFDHFQD
ncbi:copia protein [Tanacetum coccineum]